jgi:hypothetical protein
MAVGTVSGLNLDDQWQLITTTTISSGTATYTYNSLSGYKTILIAGKNIVRSGGGTAQIRLNGNSSAGSYSMNTQNGGDSRFYITGNSAGPAALAAIVYNINQAVPHKVDVGYSTAGSNASNNYYTDPVEITSIELGLDGGTYTSGTVYVYGIPA